MARHRARWWFLRWCPLALVAVTLGACSGGAHRSAQNDGGAAAFPVKLASANGAVTIPRQPQRIVSLSATATEDIYALGAGGQVVAVDHYSIYPPQAPRTQLTETSLNVEAIAKYRPDLVVLAEDTRHIVSQLRKLAIPVLVEPPASTLSSAYREIDQLGQATGHAPGAARVINRISGELAAIVRSTPRPQKPLRVYHELEPTFYSATSHTFIGEIYSMLGLQNIADAAHLSGPYPQLSDEYIIAAKPNLIVLADTVCCKQSVATVAARPGWRDITAVKDGAVVPVNDSIASQWGPRIVIFARIVAAAVRRLQKREGSR
jgi:iron complex transport system substrate-binding protein